MTNLQRHAPPQRPAPTSGEACRACLLLMGDAQGRPHARLMITSSTPMVEAFGGGVETRYVCLECGHSLTHSTGRFGEGWR